MRTPGNLTRRDFLKGLGTGALVLATGCPTPHTTRRPALPEQALRFGLIADLHHNFHPESRERLAAFIEEMKKREVDFIIQLGDFCHGYSPARADKFDAFLRLWNSFPGPKYHVLGNHDMDACTKREVMDYWQMPDNYYSFDRGGYHFVVLDSNYLGDRGQYRDYANGNYFKRPGERAYITPEQIAWLERDLAATDKPTVLFSHRGLDRQRGVRNGRDVRAVLQRANKDAGYRKAVACFCGHYHRDGHCVIDRIHHVQVNSAVYHWLGGKWKWVKYRDPLYAIVALRPGLIEIEGKESELVPHWPPGDPEAPELDSGAAPRISDRRLGY